jgi:mono/diheme cytochrome c family protein
MPHPCTYRQRRCASVPDGKPAVQWSGHTARSTALYTALLTLCFTGCRPDRNTAAPAGRDEGRRLYTAYCVQCHGSDARNDRQGAIPQMRLASANRLAEAQWREIVLRGRNEMPAFAGRLQPVQLDALHRYVRTLDSGQKD